MSKAVLISIRPKWVEKIANGEKTIEVRKTRPKKLKNPFKCYIYCTQGRDARRLRGSWGKVIGEFTCDGFWLGTPRNTNPLFCMAACMDGFDTEKYAKGKTLYGWHISGLRIYDQPKGLDEFTRLRETKFGSEPVTIKRPPQSWCYVEAMKDE